MSDKEKNISTEAEATEKPAEQVEQPAEESEQTLPNLVTAIKAQYEQQIASLNAKHAKDVAERDKLIAQLLDENKQTPTETIADRINGKRAYKKW